MPFFLLPDYRFERFDEITPSFLSSIGVRGVLLDIDNTLEPYENAVPGESVVLWLKALEGLGIKAGFVSNNDQERVELFNKDLRLTAFWKARKPFSKNVLLAMKQMGVTPEETIFIGDQIFTDVWAAKNAHIRSILLPPINDKRDIFTKFKRALEKIILLGYDKKKQR